MIDWLRGRLHLGHDWEFGAFGGGWAVFVCKNCGVDDMPGTWRKWRRCPSPQPPAIAT